MSQSTALVPYEQPKIPYANQGSTAYFIQSEVIRGEEAIQRAYVGYNLESCQIVSLRGPSHGPLVDADLPTVSEIASLAIWRYSNENLSLGRIVAGYCSAQNYELRRTDVVHWFGTDPQCTVRFVVVNPNVAALPRSYELLLDWARLKGEYVSSFDVEKMPKELLPMQQLADRLPMD